MLAFLTCFTVDCFDRQAEAKRNRGKDESRYYDNSADIYSLGIVIYEMVRRREQKSYWLLWTLWQVRGFDCVSSAHSSPFSASICHWSSICFQLLWISHAQRFVALRVLDYNKIHCESYSLKVIRKSANPKLWLLSVNMDDPQFAWLLTTFWKPYVDVSSVNNEPTFTP